MKTLKLLPLILLTIGFSIGVKAQSDKNQGCASLERPIVVTSNTCLNDSIQFDAGLFAGAEYSWDFNGDGTFDLERSTKATPKYKFLNGGTYETVVVIFTDQCESGNKNATENDLEVKNVVKPVIQINDLLCDEISAERIPSLSLTPDSILWNLYDTVLTTETINHKFSVANGTYEVSLSTFYNGCVATSTENIEIERVNVNPIITQTSNCAPATISIKNADSYKSANYAWYVDGELFSTNNEFEMPIDQERVLDVELALSNEYGCFDSSEVALEVAVAQEVIASAFLESNKSCLGEEVALKENNSGHNQRTVLWGDGSLDTINRSVAHIYNEAAKYEITIIAQNTKLACVDTFTLAQDLEVFANPTADFDFIIDGTCTPQVLEVKDLANGNYDNYSLVLNNFDTLSFDDAVIIRDAGIHEIRYEVVNQEAGCTNEMIKHFELNNPLNSTIKPFILESQLEGDDFVFSWEGVKNATEYEVLKFTQTEEFIIDVVVDTLYTIENYSQDSTYATYAVRALDACGAKSASSSFAQVIKLEGAYLTDSFPTLQWTAFEAWDEGLENYQVERNTDGNWEVVGKTSQPHFVDRDFNNNETLTATYRVKAVHNSLDIESVSTEYTFEFDPNIFIPSAFSPNYDNLNDRYEIKGYGMKNLEIQIFNEWGQRVFNSEGENIAWDGKYKGEMVEAGTYICVVEMETPLGRTYNFQRSVTIIR